MLNLSFGNMTMELNIFNVCKQPKEKEEEVHEVDLIETLVQEYFDNSLIFDPLQA